LISIVLVAAYRGVMSSKPMVPTVIVARVTVETVLHRRRRIRSNPDSVWGSDGVTPPGVFTVDEIASDEGWRCITAELTV
jgi:hypothetical protein